MVFDDEFTPKLGKPRARGGKVSAGRTFLNKVRKATNLARGSGPQPGKSARPSSFTGSRIGRGSGVGRVLSSRAGIDGPRQRRVVVKARIVKLSGKDMAAALAHMRYVQRDGVTREGTPGQLYSAQMDVADGHDFMARADGDRHQFRFIVSPEDGVQYDDLKGVTRSLMTQVENDLNTRLDWVAVDHFNTGHPHTHIIVRGRDDLGKDLIIAREYITAGLRERASEVIALDLGPRKDSEIEASLRAEVTQDRFTSLDAQLVRSQQ
jgi:type IV secretory pathway VirD2 relaxase